MPDQETYRHTLVRHFVGDLLTRTMDAPTAAAHQHALQAFLDDLSPWVLPHELPTLLGPAFSLLAFPVKTRNFVRWAHPRALDETSTLINLCL